MTIGEALFQFFSGFDIPVYHRDSVPMDADCPYLTFAYDVGNFDSGTDSIITADLWYRTESEVEPNAKAEQIRAKIGRGRTQLKIDGGYLSIWQGEPAWLSVPDDNPDIKHRTVNISAEYLR